MVARVVAIVVAKVVAMVVAMVVAIAVVAATAGELLVTPDKAAESSVSWIVLSVENLRLAEK